MDQNTPPNSRQSMLSFSRTKSVRLHGFQQNRAVSGIGLRMCEKAYLQAAADGDIEKISQLLKYPREQLNRNCTDNYERTSLVLAILNRRAEMVEFLLENKVDLTESLFYAIETEFTAAVEAILNSEAAEWARHKEMLITSEESVFPMFLSPIMLAAQKNNYEILDILYSHGHRLTDFSQNATNKWDQIRLRWQYYKARASQAYMILMYHKQKVDPLNAAIEFCGQLRRERRNEAQESYDELAKQCEDFAIALLNQVRTAQELADILRFRLVDREHPNTNQLAMSALPVFIAPGPSDVRSANRTAVNVNLESDISGILLRPKRLENTPQIRVTDASNGSTPSARSYEPVTSSPGVTAAGTVRTLTDGQGRSSPSHNLAQGNKRPLSANDEWQLKTCSLESETRRLSATIDSIPGRRRRTLAIRRPIVQSAELEHARPIHFLKPIEKAVDSGMVRLVTCENSQIALAYLKDGLLFRNAHPLKVFLLKFFIAIFFPFISIAFYLWPSSRIGRIARNPTAKLWMEVASDIFLIFILILNIVLNELDVSYGDKLSPLLVIAYFWMPGKLLNLIFLWYHQRSRVFFSIWNWNDIGSIVFYTMFMVLRVIAVVNNHTLYPKDQFAIIPLADIMMCTVYILVFLRPLEILRANRTFGPLQISVDRMMKDVTKFFLLFLVVWFAFSCGINVLFSRYRPEATDRCNHTTHVNTSDKEAICCSEHHKFTNLVSSLQVHFWSIFGYSDDYASWFDVRCDVGDRDLTSKVGEIFFALYHIGTVLVMINMLIAIMSGTLQKTIDQSDIQWQFHRTRVWIRFIRTGFYRPPPMNILPRPKEVWFACKLVGQLAVKFWRFCNRCCSRVRLGRQNSSYEVEMRLANARRQRSDARRREDSTSVSSMDGADGGPDSHSRNEGFLPRSISKVVADEVHSTYDIALKICVKRYVKTHVIQTENTHFEG